MPRVPVVEREREKRERLPQKIIALLIHSFVLPNFGPNRIKPCPSDTIGKATIDEEEDEVEKKKESLKKNTKKKDDPFLENSIKLSVRERQKKIYMIIK